MKLFRNDSIFLALLTMVTITLLFLPLVSSGLKVVFTSTISTTKDLTMRSNLHPNNDNLFSISSTTTENDLKSSEGLDVRHDIQESSKKNTNFDDDSITHLTRGKGSTIRASSQVFSDDAYEQNDIFQNSAFLELGSTFRQGSPLGNYLVGIENESDFFWVTAPAGYNLMIEIRYNSSEIDFDLFVYDGPAENNFVAGIPSTDSIESVLLFTPIETTYFIKINASNSLNASYFYTYELDVFAEDDFGSNPDFTIYNNETIEEDAIELPLLSNPMDVYPNLTIQNFIRGNDTFQFLVWQSNIINLTINVVNFTSNIVFPEVWVYLLYPNQTVIDTKSLINSKGLISIVFPADVSGWFYARISFIDNPAVVPPGAGQVFYQLYLELEDVFDKEGHFNNVFSSAPMVDNSQGTWTFIGQWTSGKYPDFFRVQLENAERVTIRADFFGAISNINVYFYNDSTMTNLITSSASTDRDVELIEEYRASRAGYHYLFINSTIQGLRYYNLTITILGPDDEFEENDGIDDAAFLPTDPATYDLFLIKTEFDTFVVTLGQGDFINVTITFNGSQGNLDLFLMGGSLFNILDQGTSTSGDGESVQFLSTLDIFNILILVQAPSGGGISGVGIEYTLTIEVNAGDDAFEPNDSFTTAVPLNEGNTTGLLVRSFDEDWFKIYLFPGEQVNITIGFKHALGDVDLYFIDRTNSIIAQSVTNADQESIIFTASYEGLHYIRIQLFDQSVNSYWLSISYPDDLMEDSEDNDDFTTAYPLEQGLHENFSIRIGDVDVYKINVSQPEQAIVIFAAYNQNLGNLIMELYHPNGSILGADELFGTNVDYIPALAFPNPDTYYLVIRLDDEPGFLTYDLNITIAAVSELLNIPPISFLPFPLLSTPTLVTAGPSFGIDPVLVIGAVGAGVVIGGGLTAGGIIGANKFQVVSKLKTKIKK